VSGVAIDAISRKVRRPDADGADGEPSSVGVRQPHPSRPELSAQEPVFDDQVGDDFAFVALEPTGEHQEQPLESRGVEHERQLISRLQHVDRTVGHYGLMMVGGKR
jgi:hypothetical protein